VRQTVVLNSPGEQGGFFSLEVNERRVIERNGVYFRGEAQNAKDRSKRKRRKKKPQGLGDLIGDLLGGLLFDAGNEEQEAEVTLTAEASVAENISRTAVGLEGGKGRVLLEMFPLEVKKVVEPILLATVDENDDKEEIQEYPDPPPVRFQLQK
jgi:hypothetical protein